MPRKRNWIYKALILCCIVLGLFFYFFPIQFAICPISPTNLLQCIGGIWIFAMIIKKNGFINKPIAEYCLLSLFIICLGVCATSIFSSNNDYSIPIDKGAYNILYMCAAFAIVRLTDNYYCHLENTTIVIIKWLVLITVIYAIISICFFLFPELYNNYLSIITISDYAEQTSSSLSKYRLVGASTKVQYANAATHYGITLWGIIFLIKQKNNFFSTYRIISYLIITILVVAGIFSGRTFLVIILLTIVYLFLLNKKKHNRILRTGLDFISIFCPVFIVSGFLISYIFITNPMAIDWAFEMFINLSESGEISTNSTDTLGSMWHIFPDNFKTWILGDGKAYAELGYYVASDVGYIRSIFYWGLLGTFSYYFIHLLYYKILINTSDNYALKSYYLMILIWFFIYNGKEFWTPLPYLILFLVASVVDGFAIQHCKYPKFDKIL